MEAGSNVPFPQFYYANTTTNDDFAWLGGRRRATRPKNHASQQRKIDLGIRKYSCITTVRINLIFTELQAVLQQYLLANLLCKNVNLIILYKMRTYILRVYGARCNTRRV